MVKSGSGASPAPMPRRTVGRIAQWLRADSLGGGAVLLLALSVFLSVFAGKVIDGSETIHDSMGRDIYVESGNVGGLVSIAFLALAGAVALIALIQSGIRCVVVGGAGTWMVLVIIWVFFCRIVLRREMDTFQGVIEMVVGCLLALAVLSSPPTLLTARRLNLFRDIWVLASLAYSAIFVDAGQSMCRLDKCGIFGSMYTGFAGQENSASKMVALLVPLALAAATRRRMFFSVAIAGVFVLASGSRTGLLSFIAALAFVLWAWFFAPGRERPGAIRVPLVLTGFPLVALGASIAVFLFISPMALTGRGVMYAGIRSQLTGVALLIGSGADTMTTIFERGLTRGYNAVGEHGEAPHILVNGGLVAMLLFTMSVVLVAFKRRWLRIELLALGLLFAASVEFVTEPGWSLEVRTVDFLTILLFIGFFRPVAPSPLPGERGGDLSAGESRQVSA